MSKIRFRDQTGKIHEFDNVQMSTQIFDRNGVEIWEGDKILTPCRDRAVSRKARTFLEYNLVEFRVIGPNAKTIDGTSIAEPIEFRTKEIESPDRRLAYSWSEFYNCEVENDEAKAKEKLQEANTKKPSRSIRSDSQAKNL